MLQNFDKSSERFPVKKERIFLNSCGVSPLFTGALRAEYEYAEKHSRLGNVLFRSESGLDKFHSSAGKLLRTSPENISLMKNCAEPLNLIAQGYPFVLGDEIISYAHEYPSNHYPWRLQEKRGVKLTLLSDCDPQGSLPPGKPRGFSFGELERLITPRTKVVALSHVQFTSGFAADLESIGKLCRAKGIDLVVDAAQSLGSLPLYPESLGIAAVVASGWKWLLGPIGTGLLYTSPEFREKIEITHGGPDMMAQGVNYLDYTWNPVKSGARFEYSTVTYSVAAGLLASIDQIFLKYTDEEINKEIFRL